MVLADDNFATMVAAVEEGRSIYANIRKFLRYLLSSNSGEVLTMFFGVVFADAIGLKAAEGALVLPLLATQLLWINLVSDGAPALALGIDPPLPGLMAVPPRPRDESVITRRMWAEIFFAGVIISAGTLIVLHVSMPGGLRYAQTMAFTTLVFFSLFQIFNVGPSPGDMSPGVANLFAILNASDSTATEQLRHQHSAGTLKYP